MTEPADTGEIAKMQMTDMSGRVCVLTGATSGIGSELARGLAARGATLIIIGRNAERTHATALLLGQTTPTTAVVADLSSPPAVRAAARAIAARHPLIHVLVNNAGIWTTRRSLSPEGIELTWATNVLGPHVLTHALLHRLRESAPSRIINVASTYAGDLDLDDVEFTRRTWNGLTAYRQSKLALRMWTWTLAARLAAFRITANAVHPGGTYTGIYRSPRGLPGAMLRLYARLAKASPRDGSTTPLWLSSAPELEDVTGRFWTDCRETPCGHRDPPMLDRLWNLLDAQAARAMAAQANDMIS
jgi:NAD(P)-dependent dehydrogenase (short-subunit alcohol dehydrogenase family)